MRRVVPHRRWVSRKLSVYALTRKRRHHRLQQVCRRMFVAVRLCARNPQAWAATDKLAAAATKEAVVEVAVASS